MNDCDVDEAKLGELLQAAELSFADFEAAVETAIIRKDATAKLKQAGELNATSSAALKALTDAESRLAAVRARATASVATAERAASEAREEVGRISGTAVRLHREALAVLSATEGLSIENVRRQQVA